MFQKTIVPVLLLVVAAYLTGCSSFSQKRKVPEKLPEIIEEDIGESQKSQSGDTAQQDALTDSSNQLHRDRYDNSMMDTPSQELPEGPDSGIVEPDQEAPRRLIWKGNQGEGKRWAPGDKEN